MRIKVIQVSLCRAVQDHWRWLAAKKRRRRERRKRVRCNASWILAQSKYMDRNSFEWLQSGRDTYRRTKLKYCSFEKHRNSFNLSYQDKKWKPSHKFLDNLSGYSQTGCPSLQFRCFSNGCWSGPKFIDRLVFLSPSRHPDSYQLNWRSLCILRNFRNRCIFDQPSRNNWHLKHYQNIRTIFSLDHYLKTICSHLHNFYCLLDHHLQSRLSTVTLLPEFQNWIKEGLLYSTRSLWALLLLIRNINARVQYLHRTYCI